MAKVYITEFARNGVDLNATPINAPQQTPLAEQTVAIGAGSVQSSAFQGNTAIVRLHTDAICSVAFGANPTATANTMRMAAGQTEYFTVPPNGTLKVAVITNT